jgi:protein involved in polysaccharide export with SLBB domain
VIVRDADAYGIEPGDHVSVEITAHETMYVFGRPV